MPEHDEHHAAVRPPHGGADARVRSQFIRGFGPARGLSQFDLRIRFSGSRGARFRHDHRQN